MRFTSRKIFDTMDMEYMVERTLDEAGDVEGGIVEKLAEIIARGRSIAAKGSLIFFFGLCMHTNNLRLNLLKHERE